MNNSIEPITCFVFDIDGVLTDGTAICLESGEQARTFNIKDGYGIERALLAGYHVAIISGGNQIGVRKRLEFLKIKHIFLGVKDKVESLQHLLKELQLNTNQVLFMGDDLPDYDVMKMVGLPCSPADAVEEIKHISKVVAQKQGGKGCVREIIELVMKQQGTWRKFDQENINN
ncbi:MAG: HAD-IIIA family hydrolase [Bacteroidia bacterium]|jgi:3-deoxy-D-manno-octulosonate 8-phosphate phosphatase (KDO 8-P phosphatase)|nr:HAD-IIIA family hydrolase [Bacteroidia bacterium]